MLLMIGPPTPPELEPLLAELYASFGLARPKTLILENYYLLNQHLLLLKRLNESVGLNFLNSIYRDKNLVTFMNG